MLPTASVKSTARTVVSPLIGFYNGSQQGFTPNAPFKRDDAGAALFGALIDYWHYTGDGQYNRLATELLAASTDANPPLVTHLHYPHASIQELTITTEHRNSGYVGTRCHVRRRIRLPA